VRFSPQGLARQLTRRQSPGSALLIWTLRSNLDLDVVEVDDWEATQIAVRSLTGRDLDAASGEAVVFFHNFEVPERDRVAEFSAWGRLEHGVVNITSRRGTRDLGPPETLRERKRSIAARTGTLVPSGSARRGLPLACR
jgi:hypothetical protein